MRKTIPIDRLALGMYVVGLDRSWLQTPFIKHRWLLREGEDLARLKACGVKAVTIDTSRGLDVAPDGTGEADSPSHAPQADDPSARRRDTAAGNAGFEQDVEAARAVHADARLAVERVFNGIKTGAPLDSPALRTAVTTVLDRLTAQPMAMLTLVQLQQMRRLDRDMFSHVVDVSILSLIVGRARGLHQTALEHLGLGALLHDIGETRLPQNLLYKSGPYTDQERRLLQLHPRIGVALLTGAGPLPAAVRAVVAEHHERLDGSGYPDGLAGSRIAELGRIVGLVDVYDAMVSRRGGRPALSPAQAVRHLFQLGLKEQYERPLVELLIQCLGVYPFGSLVELSTGEQAVVYAVHPEEPLRPSVKLITDPQGRAYPEPVFLDLAAPQPDEIERAIVRVLDTSVEQVDGLLHQGTAPQAASSPAPAAPGGRS